ncbi:MAG: hypothetical protein NC250_01270 [Alistipes senegalensis]|nr:hypothetical protein [Bacteroides cellulosilyticus]MCM1351349.1 hypothetical protein [Alistipes senegalensis]
MKRIEPDQMDRHYSYFRMMDQITALLLSVRTRLGESVSELEYIDKDWGQLSCEVPSVKWPCALLDVENVDYTQEGGGRQLADTQIVITVADLRLASASSPDPNDESAYGMLELLEKIHRSLHLFTAGGYAPLFRTNLKKIKGDHSYECYRLTYQTAFEVGFDTETASGRVDRIELDMK